MCSLAQGFKSLSDFAEHLAASVDIVFPVIHGQFGEDGGIQVWNSVTLYKTLTTSHADISVFLSAYFKLCFFRFMGLWIIVVSYYGNMYVSGAIGKI